MLPPNEIIGLEAAAQLLMCCTEHLRQLAAKGQVPGRKVGRRWVFARAALIEWVSSSRGDATGGESWASTNDNGQTTIGRASRSTAEQCRRALGLPTGAKRKNGRPAPIRTVATVISKTAN